MLKLSYRYQLRTLMFENEHNINTYDIVIILHWNGLFAVKEERFNTH